jgi:DNA-binding MarR family transcriptional regulator
MGPDLENAIHEISLRMRLLRAMQEDDFYSENLTERDFMIIDLLNEKGKMPVSKIAAAYPNVSESTISTNITKLWNDKKMVSKTISPENQRVTIVELTDKGRKALEILKKQRAERFKTLFHAIKVTNDEQQVFIKVLNRAIKFFDKYLVDLEKNNRK